MQARTSLVRRHVLWAPVAALVLLAGCSTLAPKASENVVQQRAQQYWNARIAGKPEQAYELSTPAYRKLRSAEQFQRQLGNAAGVRSAEVRDVACEPERCKVRVELQVRPALLQVDAGLVSMYIDEIWLLEEGMWWHHQEL